MASAPFSTFVREERLALSRPARAAMPVVFGPASAQLFGLYHAPEPAFARGTGVVLCNPFGYEAMCAHRTYRHLAERLAAAGHHALRFDYHGTGDSAGRFDEPGRVRAWLDSIGIAVDELRRLTGVRVVDLFGVRLGGTLAAVAAGERRDIRSLVLWGPSATGRAYVRELRAFRMIKEPRADGGSSALKEGDEEVAGYLFERATITDLSVLDLLAQKEPIVERALIIPRDDLPGGEQRLATHLDACGVKTLLRVEPGYANMMIDPEETVVPFAMLDGIVEWLGERRELEPARTPERFTAPHVLTATSPTTQRPLREESMHFGAGNRIFGILTEPTEGAAVGGRPAILFLNVGANHHVGPNRMYVSLARDLAALGYLAFRFDLTGLGDSRIVEGPRSSRLYSSVSIGDVRSAVTFLANIRDVKRVVVVGICSGARVGFRTGIVDPRVCGQILINPQTFDGRETTGVQPDEPKAYKSTRYYLRALFDRAVWAQALHGALDFRSVAGVLRERLAARATAGLQDLRARWRHEPIPRTEVEREFLAMSDRGVESLLVFSSSDGGLDMLEQHLGHGAHKIRGRKNMRLEIVDGADHTFSLLKSQHDLHAMIMSFIQGAFP